MPDRRRKQLYLPRQCACFEEEPDFSDGGIITLNGTPVCAPSPFGSDGRERRFGHLSVESSGVVVPFSH